MVKKTDFNAKITETKGKIPSITGIATSSALTSIENKIADVSSFVKKKQITTPKYQILKRKLLILIMTNILLLQNLILWQQMFLMQD